MKLQFLKDKIVWPAFSQWIRQRDADQDGICTCITCGARKPWQEMQAGHSIGGRTNNILFNEKYVYAQCYRCNVPLHGNYTEYTLVLIDRFGRDFVEQMKRDAKVQKQYSEKELWELFIKYSTMANAKTIIMKEVNKMRTKARNLHKQAERMEKEANDLESKLK